MIRSVWIITLLLAAAGCRNEVQTSLWQQIKSLSEEKTELSLEVQRLERENAKLTDQVKTLAAMDRDERLDVLAVPESVRIGRHSGLYDKSGPPDGTPDTLVVYLEPIDAEQDVIKAPGRVRVELWNLAADADRQARLKQWDVTPGELRSLWGRGLLGAYYRLQLPLDGILTGDEKELTVRVRFTDYLTGRVLTDQARIKN